MRFYESTARLEPRVGYAAGWIGVVESEGRIVERKVSLGEAGRASQFATFSRTFEMNFLKYKTNNTYNTNTLSLEEYHRICPSVHHLSLTEARPSDAVLRTGAHWFQRVPSFDRAADAQDEAVPFQFRSVLFHVQYLSRPDGFRWIEYIKVPEGYTLLWYPCQHALNSFQLFFWKPLPIFSNRKVIRFRTCQVPI